MQGFGLGGLLLGLGQRCVQQGIGFVIAAAHQVGIVHRAEPRGQKHLGDALAQLGAQFPKRNAWGKSDLPPRMAQRLNTLVYKQYFHIGFAADTPNGLVVPVIRDADTKGVIDLARESGELAKKARDGKLGPADMSGGCFSISSLGGIGGTAFTPIVNAPEVSILGVSKSAIKPVWNGEKFKPRLILPLSLSYDHRVIDGASAARFTAYLAQVLADMRRVLL